MRLESLCVLLGLAAMRDFDVIQFNITAAYLHGTLKEEVYMEQPDGTSNPVRRDHMANRFPQQAR